MIREPKHNQASLAERLLHDAEHRGTKAPFNSLVSALKTTIENENYTDAERIINFHFPDDPQQALVINLRALFLCDTIPSLFSKKRKYEERLGLLISKNTSLCYSQEALPYQILLQFVHNARLLLKNHSDNCENTAEYLALVRFAKTKVAPIIDLLKDSAWFVPLTLMMHDRTPRLMLWLLQKAKISSPNDNQINLCAVRCLKNIKSESALQKAVRVMNFAINRDTHNPALWHKLGLLYLKTADLREAQDSFFTAHLLDEENDTYTLALGDTYLQAYQVSQALATFESLLERQKGTPSLDLSLRIAECALILEEFPKAETHLRLCLALDTEKDDSLSLQIQTKLLSALIKSGKIREAITMLDSSPLFARNQTHIEVVNLKTDLLLAQGKTEEAESFLMGAISRNCENAAALRQLIEMQLRHRSLILARFYINLLKKDRRDRNEALIYEAAAEYLSGEIQTAADLIEQAHTEDPLAREYFFRLCPLAKDDIRFNTTLKY